ncbi:hypothetical protein ABVK25_011974 [Lepraria finkii]|uniref:Uncharacterized protein n=1 Tax=Lepraria finkii TaxID=1340010 RepID=A0ABR4AM28_9LECA
MGSRAFPAVNQVCTDRLNQSPSTARITSESPCSPQLFLSSCPHRQHFGDRHLPPSLRQSPFSALTLGRLASQCHFPPNGLVAVTPNAAGTITGSFNGHVVENLTASVERFQPSESGLYSAYVNEILFANADDENLLVKIDGLTTYQNKGLHGFGKATFETTIPSLQWTNYAMFVAEWMGSLNSGTGNAKLQIFEIMSGGRRDGKPIDALNGTSS